MMNKRIGGVAKNLEQKGLFVLRRSCCMLHEIDPGAEACLNALFDGEFMAIVKMISNSLQSKRLLLKKFMESNSRVYHVLVRNGHVDTLTPPALQLASSFLLRSAYTSKQINSVVFDGRSSSIWIIWLYKYHYSHASESEHAKDATSDGDSSFHWKYQTHDGSKRTI